MNYTEQDIEKAKQLKLDGCNWVARDKSGEIGVFEEKPYRCAVDSEECNFWENQKDTAWGTLAKCYFEPITWESEPVYVDDIIANKTTQDTSDTIDDSKDAIIYSLTAQCKEYKRRVETAETVISELRSKLAKSEYDRKRYKAKIKELRKEK